MAEALEFTGSTFDLGGASFVNAGSDFTFSPDLLFDGVAEPTEKQQEHAELLARVRTQRNDPNNFNNQFNASFANFLSASSEGVATIASAAGLQGAEDFAREIADSYQTEAQSYGVPDVTDIAQVMENPELIGDYAKHAIAQALPSIMGIGAAGLAGVTAGATVGAAGAGGLLAIGVGSLLANTGEVAQEIDQKGGSNSRDTAALGAGTLMAGLDVFGLTRVLGVLARPLVASYGKKGAVDELVKIGVAKGTATAALTAATTEGVTEGIQESIGATVAGLATGKEVTGEELWSRVRNATAIGAISGGGVGSFAGTAGAIVNNQEFQKQQTDLSNAVEAAAAIGIKDPEAVKRAFLSGQAEELLLRPNDNMLKADYNPKNAPGLLRMALEVIGGKSATVFDRYAFVKNKDTGELGIVGSMREIRNKLLREEGGQSPAGFDVFEEATGRHGKYHATLAPLLNRFKKKEGDLLVSAIRDDQVLLDLAQNDPAKAQAVAEIKELLTSINNDASGVGIQLGFLENFFPRLYNTPLVEKKRAEFTELLARHGYNAGQQVEIIEKIIKGEGMILDSQLRDTRMKIDPDTGVLTGGGGRVSQFQDSPNVSTLERTRNLARIPDEELAPYLVNDPFQVLNSYIEKAAKDVEYARAFGAREEILNGLIVKANREHSVLTGQGLPQHIVDRIYGVMDAYNNLYRPIRNPKMAALNRSMVTYQYVRTLPLATLASLTEPFVALARGRIGDAPVALIKALYSGGLRPMMRKFARNLSRSDLEQLADDVAISADSATMNRIAAGFGGGATQRASKIDETFFKIIGLTQWTKWTRVFSLEMGRKMITGNLKKIAEQQSTPGSRQYTQWVNELKELGLNPQEAVDWYRDGADIKDPRYQQIKMGSLRFTNEVVMHPTANKRPLWQSNPHLRLVTQLKGFATMFGNTVMKRWALGFWNEGAIGAYKNAAHLAPVVAMMMTTAFLVDEFKEYIQWGDQGNPSRKNDTDYQNFVRAMDRSGFPGIGTVAMSTLNAHKFGGSPLDPILGPAGSQFSSVLKAVSQFAFEDKPAALRNEVAKGIPGLSVSPVLKEMFRDWAERNWF